MQLIQNLYDLSYEKALHVRVACLTIGLRYTAVVTDDGEMGIAFTYLEGSHCCQKTSGYRDYEGENASELLPALKASLPLQRSMGLALVNALNNYQTARSLPEDSDDRFWMDAFGIGRGTHVAMVGFFRPLMKKFMTRGAVVEVLDDGQGIGSRHSFYEKLNEWADVLLLTSTSILNDTAEEILGRVGPTVNALMLGPSTPMIAGAFAHLPVRMLAGTVPVDQPAVLKAVRHGEGTPVIQRFSRKVYAATAKSGGALF